MPKPLENEPSQTQSGQSLCEKMLQECLRGELRVVNAGVPQSQKRLSTLLNEQYPYVLCNDGSTHFFKRSELQYLASLLEPEEQEALPLPILIELGANQNEATVICGGNAEEKIISIMLNMPVVCQERRIRLYKPQLALLRRKLKTATVYIFSPRTNA